MLSLLYYGQSLYFIQNSSVSLQSCPTITQAKCNTNFVWRHLWKTINIGCQDPHFCSPTRLQQNMICEFRAFYGVMRPCPYKTSRIWEANMPPFGPQHHIVAPFFFPLAGRPCGRRSGCEIRPIQSANFLEGFSPPDWMRWVLRAEMRKSWFGPTAKHFLSLPSLWAKKRIKSRFIKSTRCSRQKLCD